MTVLKDYFTVEFTNIEAQNVAWLKEILEEHGVVIKLEIARNGIYNILCQHQDYNILLFATKLYLDSLEKRLKLENNYNN